MPFVATTALNLFWVDLPVGSVFHCIALVQILAFYSVLNGGGLDPPKSTMINGVATMRFGARTKLHYKVKKTALLILHIIYRILRAMRCI